MHTLKPEIHVGRVLMPNPKFQRVCTTLPLVYVTRQLPDPSRAPTYISFNLANFLSIDVGGSRLLIRPVSAFGTIQKALLYKCRCAVCSRRHNSGNSKEVNTIECRAMSCCVGLCHSAVSWPSRALTYVNSSLANFCIDRRWYWPLVHFGLFAVFITNQRRFCIYSGVQFAAAVTIAEIQKR